MKIEKINDNQIRCTLTPEDLKARDIRISELTYPVPRHDEGSLESLRLPPGQCTADD